MRRLGAKIAIAIHDSRAARSQRPHKEEVRGGEAWALISPPPRLSFIAPFVTTILYSTILSLRSVVIHRAQAPKVELVSRSSLHLPVRSSPRRRLLPPRLRFRWNTRAGCQSRRILTSCQRHSAGAGRRWW